MLKYIELAHNFSPLVGLTGDEIAFQICSQINPYRTNVEKRVSS